VQQQRWFVGVHQSGNTGTVAGARHLCDGDVCIDTHCHCDSHTRGDADEADDANDADVDGNDDNDGESGDFIALYGNAYRDVAVDVAVEARSFATLASRVVVVGGGILQG
jgi:hypothetical protein